MALSDDDQLHLYGVLAGGDWAGNWEKCRMARAWGTTDRFSGMMKRVKEGDLILIYVTGLKYAGIFRVT